MMVVILVQELMMQRVRQDLVEVEMEVQRLNQQQIVIQKQSIILMVHGQYHQRLPTKLIER